MPYPVHGEVDAQRVVQLVEEFDETLFLRRKPRGQVNGGRKRGPPPSPLRLPLCPSPLCPVLPPCLPSCLHPCLPSLLPPPPRCAWALGCPRSTPCSPVTGAWWQHSVAPGHAWPLQSGDPSVQDREAGECIPSAPAVLEGERGDPCPAHSGASKPGLEAGAWRGLQHRTSRCTAPGTKPSESSGKKGMGRAAVLGLRFPSFGAELLQDKARLLETERCWTKQGVGALRAPCFPAQAAWRGNAVG